MKGTNSKKMINHTWLSKHHAFKKIVLLLVALVGINFVYAKESVNAEQTKANNVKVISSDQQADEKATDSVASEVVNINAASPEEIAVKLQGVGLARAKAIVAYREEHGGFKTLEELTEVKGIGQKTFELNKDKITIE